MTRALVTGASGFLGGHLVRHLVDLGWEVTALQRASSAGSLVLEGATVVPFESVDEVQGIVRALAPDRVFHLATHYLKDHVPSDVPLLLAANITFGTNLLEGLKGLDTVVVNANSFFQFRANEPVPYSLYSATKQAFSDITRYYREIAGLDVRQVVLYDTYGPGDTRSKLVPALVAAAINGTAVNLGPSAQQINLLFASDVSRALVASSEPGAAAELAIRADATVTVREIVETFGLVGSPIEATYNDAGTILDIVTTSGEWPTPPGWAVQVSLRDGIAATLAAASASS